ncbi:MAG: hypothetical protein OEW06_03520 [Gemmatimonadota bacterium]|nr:hypothetical protein [Gemmatimonadota bacterium]
MAATATAQQRFRVSTDENFRLAPQGDARVLARVNAGLEVQAVGVDGDWREITVEGWIWERSIRASGNREFDLVVSPSGGENLRAEPGGTVIARFEAGALLNEVGRRGGWVQVRRTAWMWSRSLAAIGAAATPAASPRAGAATPPAAARGDPPTLDRRSVAPGSGLLAGPAGDTIGQLTGRAGARVVARADGWARVLVEAWVREEDLTAADDSVLTGVTAAEVRGGGPAYEGRTLRWTLQYIAVQTADELRRDMPLGQAYMLARGPLPETGFVYLLLSAEQARAVVGLEPLARIAVIGRVRAARSHYLGNPVLDLIEFAVQSEPLSRRR